VKGSFYIRWLLVLLVLGAVAAFAFQRYQRDVAHIAPAAFAAAESGKSLRILGRVQAGSLKNVVANKGAEFILEGGGAQVRVVYQGPDTDTLRELKTLLVQGVRQADGTLLASQASIDPNYDFIALAFGVVATILGVFGFVLDWRVLKMRETLGEAAIKGAKMI
jgi:cytochrome c-type biogenesis protein CcmE